MQLPVRLAVSLPLAVAMVAGMVVGLAGPDGRKIHPIYGLPNGLFIGFFFGLAALLLVVPNIVAAIAANRLAADSAIAFVGVLAAAVVGTWLVQGEAINSLFRSMGKPIDHDWRVIAVLAADIGLLALIAWWSGAPDG